METQKNEAPVDHLANAHTALVESVEALIKSGDWTGYLKIQAAFTNYSFQNVIWLSCQAEARGIKAVKFAGFHTWKQVGRSVKKGEKGFKVLAPIIAKWTIRETGETSEPGSGVNEVKASALRGFKVVTTFEKSQTEVTDPKKVPKDVCKTLEGSSEECVKLFGQVQRFIEGKGFSVARGRHGTANGVLFIKERAILVDPDLSETHALKTLVHETAHALLHADDIGAHGTEVREVEAESVAFVVLNALGIDSGSYSFGYVAGWSGGKIELVKKTGERVQRAAKTILEALGKKGESEESA